MMNKEVAPSSLEDIQVGDLVTIQKRNHHRKLMAEVTKVSHVTPKQFVADGYSFWKKDGRSLQAFDYIYKDMRFYASIPTPDEVRQYEEAKEQLRLIHELSKMLHEHGSKVPLETLRQLSKTIEGFISEDIEHQIP